MSRNRGNAFNAAADTGLMAFRYPGEAPDDRPVIRYLRPFWEDGEEALWLKAVHACPLHASKDLDWFAYLREIGKVATGLGAKPPLHVMPRRMSRREQDRRLIELRKQGEANEAEAGGFKVG